MLYPAVVKREDRGWTWPLHLSSVDAAHAVIRDYRNAILTSYVLARRGTFVEGNAPIAQVSGPAETPLWVRMTMRSDRKECLSPVGNRSVLLSYSGDGEIGDGTVFDAPSIRSQIVASDVDPNMPPERWNSLFVRDALERSVVHIKESSPDTIVASDDAPWDAVADAGRVCLMLGVAEEALRCGGN